MRRRFGVVAAALVLAILGGVVIYFVVDPPVGGQEDKTLLERTNEKFARIGFPTLASEDQLTWTPLPEPFTPTPGPSPIALVPECAQGTISGAEAIVATYGGSSSRCGAVGRFLYFAISGWYDTPLVDDQGGIAVYACAADDPCTRGDPGVRSATWTFYPAPAKGRFKVVSFAPPDTLIIQGMGQICFNLRTGEYITTLPCVVEPTVPPGPPWPVTPYIEPTPFDPGTPPVP